MSSPFYATEADPDVRRPTVPETPFASTSASAHHQHLLQTVQRDRRRLRTFTQDSHNTADDQEDRSPWGDFSGTTPYLYKHSNQTPRGYDPASYSANGSTSTAPTTDPNSISTPSAFTPFRRRPQAPIFDPSSPFSQAHEFGPTGPSSRSGPGGGAASTDAFRSGAANMRARLFKEYGPAGMEQGPTSSPAGLGAGIFLGGGGPAGGGPSANSLGKQRQRTTSRPLEEDMLVHSSPVRVVDPREFQDGGAFGGGPGNGEQGDEDEEEDLGRELGEAELSFVGYGVSPVKHPAAGGGEQTSWSLMGGEEPPFGGHETQLFWDEMASREAVELPFGSVRAERGRGRNMMGESTRKLDPHNHGHESAGGQEKRADLPAPPGQPPSSMHVRVHSDDTTNAGSSPSRQQIRHQRSFHTRVRSDETTTYRVPYQPFEVDPNPDGQPQQPSTPPAQHAHVQSASNQIGSPYSNASPRRNQIQHHHQAREIPSPIPPHSNWTFPADILGGNPPPAEEQVHEPSSAYAREPLREHQVPVRIEPVRRMSYADQLFQQQQSQYLQLQQRQQQHQSEPHGNYDHRQFDEQQVEPEADSDGGDNTPTLEPHTDRSPAFSHPSRSQPGTPAATFENQFQDQDEAHEQQLQQQQQPPPPSQQRFLTQDPHQGQHEQMFHPLHPFPGFTFAPGQQVEQASFGPPSGQYIFSPPVQQQQQFAPAPTSTHLLVPQAGQSAAFRGHRRIVSFDADTSPHLGFSPQVDQSPMFQGQAFPGGQEDYGLTNLLQQARMHQNEGMYQPMGLVPEDQFEEMVAEGAHGGEQMQMGAGFVGYDESASGQSSVSAQGGHSGYVQVPGGRPFPSVLALAGSNAGIGLAPAQGFPAGFHPSSSQLPGGPGYGPSSSNLTFGHNRVPSSSGMLTHRPPNTAGSRRVTPAIPPGHDPSFNTFAKGPRVAPIDELSYSASMAPSSGKAASSSKPVERQMHRGFPIIVGPGTRMRPGPKAKPKPPFPAPQSARPASASYNQAGSSAFPASGSAGEALGSVVYLEPHPMGPMTQAVLDQQQRNLQAASGHLSRQGSEASQSSNSPREGREDSEDASDDEGSVNSGRPTITSALIESLYTTIRASSAKRTSAHSAGGVAGFEDEMGESPFSRKKGKKVDIRYRCLVAGCERYFPRKSAIVNHIQTHLEDKPFNCPAPGCDASFVRQHDLRRHERIHSGTKPFPCACGKGFARGDALMRHRQRGICAGSIVPRKSD